MVLDGVTGKLTLLLIIVYSCYSKKHFSTFYFKKEIEANLTKENK